MRTTRAAIALSMLLVLASCGREAPPTDEVPPLVPTTSPSVADPPDARVSPFASDRSPIALPALPAQGVVVQGLGKVVLLDLAGAVLARLRGFEVWSSDVDGPVVLRGSGGSWALDPDRGVLQPISPRRASSAASPDPKHLGALDLRRPIGARYEGTVVGHWRFALPSPDGSVLLAQWSGECEVPVAFFARPGERPVAVTGERGLDGAPESLAMGWTPDSRAVVYLPLGACGSGFATPGVYLFDAPGVGTLVAEVPDRGGVAMWGTA